MLQYPIDDLFHTAVTQHLRILEASGLVRR
jgi:hypothetical protein